MVVPEPMLSENGSVPDRLLVYHLSPVVPEVVSDMLPVKPATPAIMVLVIEVSLKLRLRVPAPVKVLAIVTLVPVALVLFNSSVAPEAMLAAPVPMLFCVVFTLARISPALIVVVPE